MDSLPIFLFPAVEAGSLLVPVLGVAEIVTATPPRKLYGVPKWIHGFSYWRETEILVIDYQFFMSHKPLTREKPRIVILNTIRDDDLLPFVGMLIDGMPQRSIVSENDLNDVKELSLEGHIWHQFSYLNKTVWIAPDVEIEAEVAKFFV